ncbi:MAG: hypothetical protein WCE68_01750 [Anaerolineales bacterium]
MKNAIILLMNLLTVTACASLPAICPAAHRFTPIATATATLFPTPTQTPSGLVTAGPGNGLPALYLTATAEKTIDLAPQVSEINKAAIIIQCPDGSLERYLLTPDGTDAFIKGLPNGVILKNVIPPQSLMGPEPPFITP